MPKQGGFAARLAMYLWKVNYQLNVFKGRVFYTGLQYDKLKKQHMGKNTIAAVPHEIAAHLKLNPEEYTFHSFRRTAASAAADGGSTSEQMTSFFGWKDSSMCQQYISTSKPAVNKMAMNLVKDFNMDDPIVEVDVELETEVVAENPPAVPETPSLPVTGTGAAMSEVANDTMAMETDDNNFMMSLEEDPDLYAAAGLPIPHTTVHHVKDKVDIESAIKTAISSAPNMQGANVTVKVVVISGNHNVNNINF